MSAERTIVLTGVTGKFGRILCKHFLQAGDTVIGCGRSEEKLVEVSKENIENISRFHGIVVDFLEYDSVDNFCSELSLKGLQPDCLINNARSIDYLYIQDNGIVSRENFCNEYMLDVVVPYELTMKLSLQKPRKLKHVVNIGSQYGVVAVNPELYSKNQKQSPVHYGVAKAALMHLTKELAVKLASRGVQVNCVAFGGVKGRVDADFERRYARLCPSGKMLDETELAGPVDMLLSDHSSAITGQTIIADGGWSIW